MANKTTLNDNEFIPVLPNRSGEQGFNKEGFTEFVYTQLSLIASMNMLTPVNQIFNNGVISTVNVFDNISIQSSDTIIANTGLDTITVKSDGTYRISSGLSLEFPSLELLGFQWFINGIELNNNFVQVKGEGNNNPITTSWEVITDLITDDVIDIRGTNIQPGSLDASFLAVYFTVQRIG